MTELPTGEPRRGHHDAMTETLSRRPEFMVTLELAVPMWAQRWAGRPADQLVARARAVGEIVTHHGDVILYRVKGGPTRVIPAQEPDGGWQTCGLSHAPPPTVIPNPSSGEAFNALAEGIALLSLLSPAGVELFGRHFHDGWVGPDRDTCPRPQCF